MTVRCLAIGGVADGRTIEVDSGLQFYTVPAYHKFSVAELETDEKLPNYEPVKHERYRVERLFAGGMEFWFLIPVDWKITSAMCKLIEGYRPLLPRKEG